MKRVLIFSTAYVPFIGGAEVAIREIADRLAGSYEFDLITARFSTTVPAKERIGTVTVHRIGIGVPLVDKLWLPWGGALKALQLNRTHRYGLFWGMMATYGTGAAYIANWFIRPRVPIILTLQEGDSEQYLRTKWAGLVDLSWRLALHFADALTVISNYLGARARRLGYRGDIAFIPNAVNTEHFSQPISTAERAETRKAIGLADGDVALVTTSRLVKKNAVDDVIRAMVLLPENVHFIVYGIGPDEEALRALAKEQGVEGRVHFMGQIGHAQMPRALKSCDIFIRPSRSEGMGNSFIEAMAAKLPVIATQEGGIADFLFDAKRNPDAETTGWAVDKDAPEEIAAAVEDIIEHPEQAARVVATAKRLAFEQYDWRLIAARMKTLFDRLLG